jgi:hypothetical protein
MADTPLRYAAPEGTDSLALVSSTELRECLLQAEVCLRQAYSHMVGVVAEMENRRLAQTAGFRDCASLLSRLLRISHAEARDRVEHAIALAPMRSPAGEPLPVALPAAAEALAAGELGTAQLRVIMTTMSLLGEKVGAAQREQVETDLVAHARDFEPRRLAVLARRIRDHVDPDGPAPREPEPMAASAGELRLRARRDGGLAFEGWLDAEAGTVMRSLVDQLAGVRPADDHIPDRRTVAQCQGDALAEICALAAGAQQAPGAGGEPPHLNVTVPLDALRSAVGTATLDYGQQLTPSQLRRLACDAKLVPIVLGGPSEPLDVGRVRRSVPLGLRRAVAVRDRGCTFPGCGRPPWRCDVHHVRHWADGGESSLDNCCMLCPRHHREVHRTGWDVTVHPDRVEFVPPAILDPLRRPLTNPYWRLSDQGLVQNDVGVSAVI